MTFPKDQIVSFVAAACAGAATTVAPATENEARAAIITFWYLVFIFMKMPLVSNLAIYCRSSEKPLFYLISERLVEK
jgi:hypothetical protein